jgi:tetratricopeptide (TPR) repeat protein
MNQTRLSTDEPRIVNEPTNDFWQTFQKPILIGTAALFLIAGIIAWNWNQKRINEERATNLFLSSSTPESWLSIVNEYPNTSVAADCLLNLAVHARSEEKFQQAANYYTRFVENFPKHPTVPAVELAIALSWEADKNTSAARAAYQNIINTKSEHPFLGRASIGLAKLEQQDGHLDRAKQILKEFLNRNGRNNDTAQQAKRLLDEYEALK